MKTFKPTPVPKSSPWGKVQDAMELAPGIWRLGTAGHGGIKLSRGRNACVPAYMRAEGGWYEEDCQWSFVAVVFPEAFDTKSWLAAKSTMLNWYPDEYGQFYGVTVTPEESSVLRDRKFATDNASNYVVTAAWGDWAKWVPSGKVGVIATIGGLSAAPKKWFLVDATEYTGGGNFVIDLARHQEIAAPQESEMISVKRTA